MVRSSPNPIERVPRELQLQLKIWSQFPSGAIN